MPRRSRRYGHGGRDVNATRRRVPSLLREIAIVLGLIAGAAFMTTDAASAAPPRVLAFGDSLTAGLGLPPDEAFPALLRAKLAAAGVAVDMINGGVSGDTSAGGLARLDWALADKPDIVLLELGANDALRGIDPAVTRDNLDKMLARIAASGAKVLLIGMKAPANWGREYQEAFDGIYPALADKYHVALYPFFLDGIALDAALNQADGLHPNLRGATIVADRIAPYVQRLIAAPAGGAG